MPFWVEKLESRRLLAIKTVDFADFPVRFDQLNFLMPDVGPQTGGLTYTLGSGDGQRTARNGVTWPDAAYYNLTLGLGGFDALNSWAMRPVIIYTSQINGDWMTGGWNLYQDMAEGPACVDDTARGATALIEDYLRNGTESSFQRARDALTHISFLMGRDGRMYNFVFLDAPEFFGWDPIQAQNKHYGYRAEYVKRTQYPPGTGDLSWLNPYLDPDHIVGWPSPQNAEPFLPHARYSIYMNDLVDGSGNDVAATWWGPIYTASGAPNGFQSDRMIKQTYTTSRQQFGFEETRTIEAYGKAMLMLAKRASVNGGLTTDETYFARFIENHANRLLRNVQRQPLTAYDSKLQSVLLAGLVDYYRAMHTTSPYGAYTPRLPADSGTPLETTDDRLTSTAIMSMIDTLATDIRSQLFRSSDWRNGIFISNATAGNWAAWGEFQIAGLSKAYQLKRSIGQTGSSVEALLNDAVYAAENFYGKHGWHYADPGPDNVRTKERTNLIQGWNALWHTNSDQSPYYNSSIVHGLAELAEASSVSGRSDAIAKRDLYLDYMKTAASWWLGNNVMLLPVYDGQGPVAGLPGRGRGASFDGIAHGNSAPWFNNNSGGESNIEGTRTMIVVKDVLARYGKPTAFAFETGPNRLPADQSPSVVSSSFDRNARAVRFRFNKTVGAAVDLSDLTLTRIDAGGGAVSKAGINVAYDPAAFELSYVLPSNLADGNYRATLSGPGIVDNFSSIMLADPTFDFFILTGDANGDRHVDESDHAIVTANFGQPGNFSDGDFNRDGTINAADQAILDVNWRMWLPPRGELVLTGTGGDDNFRVRRESDSVFELVHNAANHRVISAAVATLSVVSAAGDDTLVIDFASGVPHSDIRFTGGDGSDTVRIVGTSANADLHDQPNQITFGSTPILLSAVENHELSADGTGAIALRSLTIDTRLTIPRGQRVLELDMLTLSPAAALDLMDNSLLVRGEDIGSWNGSAYTGLSGFVQSGWNGGTWDGFGIVTSSSDAASWLRSLAIADVNGDALIMYTWGGDSELDGDLDGDDYFWIDSNLANSGSVFGYDRGDFDYDGDIDGDDYFIIDSNIAQASALQDAGQFEAVAGADVDQPDIVASGRAVSFDRPRQLDSPAADFIDSPHGPEFIHRQRHAAVDWSQRQGGLGRDRVIFDAVNAGAADEQIIRRLEDDLIAL